jgi:hypothetical protein
MNEDVVRRPLQNFWLSQLLSAYPGAPHGNKETRGLDSDFAVHTYVKTRLDRVLREAILSGGARLVILFGNAGDGKTAFLQNLARGLGRHEVNSADQIWHMKLPDGRRLQANQDGSSAWRGQRADDLLDPLLKPLQNGDLPPDVVRIVAINSGKLLEWLERQGSLSAIGQQLKRMLMDEGTVLDEQIRLIDLNQRSLVGGFDADDGSWSTDFLDTLLDRFLDGPDGKPWSDCESCSAAPRCTALRSVTLLKDGARGGLIRQRFTLALQACHQRGEVHITARELRAVLSYVFFGVHSCADLHQAPDLMPEGFWQRCFDAESAHRQGDLLAELARLDPALECDPDQDRALQQGIASGQSASGRSLIEARRQAWLGALDGFEPSSITLAQGRHLERFRRVRKMDAVERQALTRELCLGIAQLEDLPVQALDSRQHGMGVPLRVSPRTPTETVLWVSKPWERFRLEAVMPAAAQGLEALHTHVRLIYRNTQGRDDALAMGLELFHLLLELRAGVQLSGIAQAGVFANLEVYTRRLASEDTRELFGWHPGDEQNVFRIRVTSVDGVQTIEREVLR